MSGGGGKVGPAGGVSGAAPSPPQAKKVLELSLCEAIALRHKAVGSGHILLAPSRQGLPEPVAAVVVGHGLTYERARRDVGAALDDAA
ncbi:hypothetical protein [Nocardiopsis lucentensis]|uniref:hypothetical protein n=1 Tax=Nocardiopsis lucentensis TaxID=53441 RepID=UPI00034D351D